MGFHRNGVSNGKFIVTGSYDKPAKIWDGTTKECVGTLEVMLVNKLSSGVS